MIQEAHHPITLMLDEEIVMMKMMEWLWLVLQTFIKNGPFSRSFSEKLLSEEEEITMGPP